MILTLDIGNTNIKTALFDGKEMSYYWRMSTNIQKSSDEYGIVLVNLFQHVGVRPEEVEGIMISSVVPTINFTIEHMCQNYFGQTPLFEHRYEPFHSNALSGEASAGLFLECFNQCAATSQSRDGGRNLLRNAHAR